MFKEEVCGFTKVMSLGLYTSSNIITEGFMGDSMLTNSIVCTEK